MRQVQQEAAVPSVAPFDLDDVPVAERPALSTYDHVDSEEQTIWYNPLDYDVAVQVHVGSQPMQGNWDDPARLARWRALPPAKRREMQTGIRVFVIPAKQARAIPSEFDLGIQQTHCYEPDCAKGMYCRDRSHTNRQIVGGSYPRLINRGTRLHKLETPPRLASALDDERARAKEALERSKIALQNSIQQQGLAIVAAADLDKATKDMADIEARLAAAGATEESTVHKEVIAATAAGKARK
jgi:hypothetical protein